MHEEKALQQFKHTYSVNVNNKQCYFLCILLPICSLIFLGCQGSAVHNENSEPLSVILNAEQVFSEGNSYLEFQEAREELANLAESMRTLPQATQQEICDQLASFPDETLPNFQEFLARGGLTCSLDLLARIDYFWQFHSSSLGQGQVENIGQARNDCVNSNGHFRMKYLSVRPGSDIDGSELPYGHLALTFDDGPQSFITSRLLDILDSRSVKATFFMIGKSVEELPSTAWQVANRGHSIGSHSYQHGRLSRMSTRNALNEVLKGHNTLLRRFSHHNAVKPFFRFPFGALNTSIKNAVLRNGLSIFSWNIDTRDWATSHPNQLAQYTWRQIQQAGYRGTLLFHELEQTVRIMPWLLETLANAGFCLVVFY